MNFSEIFHRSLGFSSSWEKTTSNYHDSDVWSEVVEGDVIITPSRPVHLGSSLSLLTMPSPVKSSKLENTVGDVIGGRSDVERVEGEDDTKVLIAGSQEA